MAYSYYDSYYGSKSAIDVFEETRRTQAIESTISPNITVPTALVSGGNGIWFQLGLISVGIFLGIIACSLIVFNMECCFANAWFGRLWWRRVVGRSYDVQGAINKNGTEDGVTLLDETNSKTKKKEKNVDKCEPSTSGLAQTGGQHGAGNIQATSFLDKEPESAELPKKKDSKKNKNCLRAPKRHRHHLRSAKNPNYKEYSSDSSSR